MACATVAQRRRETMDAETREHLLAWILRVIPEGHQYRVMRGIEDLVAEDPSMLDRSWPEIGRMADVW